MTPAKQGSIRMNIDARPYNKGAKHTRYHFAPPQEARHKLKGAKVFSEFDMGNGFHQVPLAAASQVIFLLDGKESQGTSIWSLLSRSHLLHYLSLRVSSSTILTNSRCVCNGRLVQRPVDTVSETALIVTSDQCCLQES
jgi:hypothetical protein